MNIFFNLDNDNNNSILCSKNFNGKDLEKISKATSSKGNQLKYNTPDNEFVKICFNYQDKYWRDDIVECIASYIGKVLNLNTINQGLANIEYEFFNRKGSYSINFLKEDEVFISFQRLVDFKFSKNEINRKYKHLNNINDRYLFEVEFYKSLGLPYSDIEKYLLGMVFLDCIIFNIDRHKYNYGFIYNQKTNTYRLPPLFDFGLGAFEHDLGFQRYSDYNKAKKTKESKMKSYSTDIDKLYEWVISKSYIRDKLEIFKNIEIPDYLLDNLSYKYFYKAHIKYLKNM